VQRNSASIVELHGKVAVHRFVIKEILLNHVGFVTKAQNEIADAVLGLHLHDVPQHRAAAHLHHGLRPKLGMLAQPRALSAA
jgi:hypothetical protein